MNKYSDQYQRVSPEDPQESSVYFNKVLTRLNIDLSDPKRQLVLQWKTIVGANFSDHCKCTGIKDGTVYVVCDHPSYVFMFKMNSKEVLKNIQTTFPELNANKISVRIRST